jgi:hypothetical protein
VGATISKKSRGLSFEDLAATPESDLKAAMSGSKSKLAKNALPVADAALEKPEYNDN